MSTGHMMCQLVTWYVNWSQDVSSDIGRLVQEEEEIVITVVCREASLTAFITVWGVRSVVIFCKAFSKCSAGRWADTAATVQPYW